jgi:hypothetical protein
MPAQVISRPTVTTSVANPAFADTVKGSDGKVIAPEIKPGTTVPKPDNSMGVTVSIKGNQ